MGRILDVVAPPRMGVGFRWLLASSWTSNLGDGIGLAAGPLLVASQTRNPVLVAMAALLQRLPWLLFGLWAGAIADRVDRRCSSSSPTCCGPWSWRCCASRSSPAGST